MPYVATCCLISWNIVHGMEWKQHWADIRSTERISCSTKRTVSVKLYWYCRTFSTSYIMMTQAANTCTSLSPYIGKKYPHCKMIGTLNLDGCLVHHS